MNRRYDIAMSNDLRRQVRERRRNPDGRLHEVGRGMRSGRPINIYPWDQMRLGDFFFVPLNGIDRDNFDVRFRQVASRRDWELTTVTWAIGPDKVPGLRVCLSFIGIREIKKKAQHHHGVKGITYSDGRWTKTRSERRKAQMGTTEVLVTKTDYLQTALDRVAPQVKAAVSKAIDDAIDPPVEVDATDSPTYDRAALLKERLRNLGVNQ